MGAKQFRYFNFMSAFGDNTAVVMMVCCCSV